jgi:subtilisin family serine protease
MRRTALLFAGIALVASAAYSGEGNVRRSARRIPGRFIVALEANADTATVAGKVRNLKSAKVHKTYGRGFKGFSLELSEEDAQALAKDVSVAFVEEDSTILAAATPWGLDRIDQRTLPLNATYVSNGSGAGVAVYIVDTGIAAGNAEFGGRVAAGFNAFSDSVGSADCNGHGTHVAGVAGGATYGVAKSATLVPVRVLDCNGAGSISTLLAGIDWILDEHALSPRPSVVNMSLSGAPSSALDGAVNRVIAAGLTTVVAAGNNNDNACSSSPARVSGALTVGASTEADQRTGFSNYGPCVDLFAPGSNIISAWYSSPTATAVSSGTSASAPFVAGVAALYLERFPTASVSSVAQTVLSQATADVLGAAALGSGSPNRLLYSRVGTLDDSVQADSQLLADPGFEYGTTFWTSDICTVVNPSGCPALLDDVLGIGNGLWDFVFQSAASRSGSRRAVIGGAPKSFHLNSELVTIPSSVRKAEFSVYIWILTENKKKSAEDVLTVEIRNSAGVLLQTLATYSNLDDSATYVQRKFDLSRFRGMSIRVSFTGVQSKKASTWFLLDDAALNIWR